MTYVDSRLSEIDEEPGQEAAPEEGREALILVIEDTASISSALRDVCECLGVDVQRMPTRNDLAVLLRRERPMAVIAEMDAAGQDGCHVLMTVAAHNPDLPVLLIVEDDPILLGAIDAVEEIWQLSAVAKWPRLPGIGAIVDFLFHAGRKGGCMHPVAV